MITVGAYRVSSARRNPVIVGVGVVYRPFDRSIDRLKNLSV
jgi:hypothetical protein